MDVPINNKKIWSMKVPLKIKIFLLYLKRGVIFTKDNLSKRKWLLKCFFFIMMKQLRICFTIVNLLVRLGLLFKLRQIYNNHVLCKFDWKLAVGESIKLF